MESSRFPSSFFDLETINAISQYSQVFEDPAFKPDITSLINFDDDDRLTNEQKQTWLRYEWRRIPSIFGSSIHLLRNVSSLDVRQGRLGNCYLLSVCSVIAEFPKRLDKMFLTKEINHAGIYAVLLYAEGEPKKVVVDDRVPFDPVHNAPPFCGLSKSRNIWPILVEKAWAKHLGNYQNTIRGSVHEIFKYLTGAPTEYFISNEYNTELEISRLWRTLNDAFLRNCSICANSYSREDSQLPEYQRLIEEIKSRGLSLNHAYSCLFFFEFEQSGLKQRLVKMRNPWGKMEKGWQEQIASAYLSSPEIRANIGEIRDGVFVLSFEEFLKYFSRVYICRYSDDYTLVSQRAFRGENYQHFKVFKLNLEFAKNNKSPIFISANKPSKMAFSHSPNNEKLYYSVFIGKLRSKNFYDIEYCGFNAGHESSTCVTLENYQRAEYLLFLHFDPHNGKIVDPDYLGYLSVYAQEEVLLLEPVDPKEINEFKAFENLIYDYYRTFKPSHPEKLRFFDQDGRNLISGNSFQLPKSKYRFIIFDNEREDLHFDVLLYDLKFEKGPNKGVFGDPKTVKRLEKGQFLMIPHYDTAINYSYKFELIKSRKLMREEALKFGKVKVLIFQKREIIYYTHNCHQGMMFLFFNPTEKVLKYDFWITMNKNLVCYDFPNENPIHFFVMPGEEFCLYFEKIDSFGGFNFNSRVEVSSGG